MRLLIPGFVLYPSAMLEDVEVEEAGSDPGWGREVCAQPHFCRAGTFRSSCCACAAAILHHICVWMGRENDSLKLFKNVFSGSKSIG